MPTMDESDRPFDHFALASLKTATLKNIASICDPRERLNSTGKGKLKNNKQNGKSLPPLEGWKDKTPRGPFFEPGYITTL